jgi:hypothetical protein
MTDDPLQFLDSAEWHAPPPVWRRDSGDLEVVTGDRTDFWQDTHYGFRRDDGHFLGATVTGDFTATVTFEGEYRELYDQAGMMLRHDARTWVKTGIEFSDDVTNFSVVVTRDGRSDWSVVGVPRVSGPQRVRATRVGGALIVHYLGAAGRWHLLRLADFPAPPALRLGPMACSPERAGFRARFTGFDVGPALAEPLHGG